MVVGWGLGLSMGVWKHASIVHEIQELVSNMNISLVFIPKDQNSLADKVAKWAVELEEIFIYDVMLDSMSGGS